MAGENLPSSLPFEAPEAQDPFGSILGIEMPTVPMGTGHGTGPKGGGNFDDYDTE